MYNFNANGCCITGHRTVSLWHFVHLKHEAERFFRYLIENRNVLRFYAGGSYGFDLFMEELVLELQEEYSAINLVLALPYPGYDRYWTTALRRRTQRVQERAAEYFYASKFPSKEAYLYRNRFMVDRSRYCAAYCSRFTGGSAYTIRYARQNGVIVQNFGFYQMT